MHGAREDDLSGYALGAEEYISIGREKYLRTAACELRFIFPVFSGKRNSSGRKPKPHKATVWRSRQKETHRVTVQDAYKAARWKVTGWAGDSLDESTQQNSDYNHS